MEVKPERIAEIIRKIDQNNNMSASELADAIMQDLEKDRKLSDLEIVQKALAKIEGYLECSDSYSEVRDSFGKTLFDGCHKSLLTWAKQTINGGE